MEKVVDKLVRKNRERMRIVVEEEEESYEENTY